MKRNRPLVALLLFMLCAVSMAQVSSSLARRFGPTTFAGLGSPSAGNVRYCSNCTAAAPCGSGGSGAFAYRSGGAWNCGNGSGGGITNGAGANVLTKSDGTNIVASSLTDNGTTVAGTEPVVLTQSIGVTSTDGLVLQNNTGTTQNSPRVRWTGRNPSSQTIDWIAEIDESGGLTNPILQFWGQTNGGGYVKFLGLQSGGTGNFSLNFNSPSGANANLVYQNGGNNVWYVQNAGATDSYTILNSDASGNAAMFKMDQTGAVTFRGGTSSLRLAGTQTTVPTCSANCGTAPAIVGSDTFMRVTMGTSGVPASGWVVTFNGTWAAAPVCSVTMAKAGMVTGKDALTAVTTTTTITVVTNGTAPATTDVYSIICGGVQ